MHYLTEQELAAAEEAWKSGYDGKARVCARRAVALADEAWLAKQSVQPFRGDAMTHLRRIQQDHSLSVSLRDAAKHLSMTVTQKDIAPFSTDPISYAKIIIDYLIRNYAFEVQASLRRVP